MPVPQPDYAEMPVAGQRLVLAGAVLAVAVFGGWWVYDGARVEADRADLGLAIMALLAAEWLGVGLLLRPGGRGLRRARWRRTLVWVFGLSHVLFALLNARVPIFMDWKYGPWRFCAAFACAGVAFAYAAWSSGRPKPSASTGR